MVVAAAHQRRLILAAASLFLHSAPFRFEKRVPDFSWEEHIHRMTEAEFKLRYRVSSDSFYKLLNILKPELDVASASQASRSRKGI